MNRNTSAVPCGQPGAGLAQVSTMPIKKSRSGSKRNESVIVVNLQHCCYPIIHRVSVARYLARSLPLGALCDAARRVGIFYRHVPHSITQGGHSERALALAHWLA